MKIIRPTVITDAMLISSDIPEDDYTPWSSGTTYATGGTTMVTADGIHKVYESLVGGNLNNYPPTDVEADIPKWLEMSSTNRWKMFDNVIGSQSTQGTSMTIVIKPGVCDSIAFLNIVATQVEITVNDPVAGEVFHEVIDLLSTGTTMFSPVVINWYTYFFAEIVNRPDFVLFTLPPYLQMEITITLSYPAATVKCGCIVVGMQAFIGKTRFGLSAGLIDYSTKTTDPFGNYTILERAFSKRMSVDLYVPNVNIDELTRLLAVYRAKPLIWIGSEDYSTTMIYGFFKDFTVVIAYVNYSECSFEIEGLT